MVSSVACTGSLIVVDDAHRPAALFNAYLNRKRDDNLRNADRLAIISALKAELHGLHRNLLDHAKGLEQIAPPGSDGFLVPDLRNMVLVFSTILPKIGLLETATIRKALVAYILAELYFEDLILLGGRLHTKMVENRQFVVIAPNLAKSAIKLNQHRAGLIHEAIRELERVSNESKTSCPIVHFGRSH